MHLTSFSQQEREAKKFRSPQHPEGFVMANDNHKFIKNCKNIHKNREDIIEKTYADDGIKYPKGKNVNWSEDKGVFVHRETKEIVGRKVHSVRKGTARISDKIKKALIILALVSTHITYAHANLKEVEGLRWIPITVNGVTYEVPEHKHEFFGEQVTMWLKAIDGDMYARKYLMAGQEKATLFIGDGEGVKWLYMTEDKVWVE